MSEDDELIVAGGIITAIKPIEPPSFTFSNSGKAILTIKAAGRIEIGEGFTPDEAGRQAIEAMRSYLGFIIAAEREACAKIADIFAEEFMMGGEIWAAKQVAAAIRARAKTEG